MKKLYFLFLAVFAAVGMNAQNDTLIWEDFEGFESFVGDETEFNSGLNNYMFSFPLSLDSDPNWYSADLDGYATNNPDQGAAWFPALAFTSVDEVDHNITMAASSWFNPFNVANNWLITKSFYCSADAELTWFSAPFQTPKYLDGYKVKVSITSNDPDDFDELIFTAKEYESYNDGTDSCLFANYTFSPSGSGYVHGISGTDVVDNVGDCQRDSGLLTKHTVSLAQFGGQRIYIAFVHDSDDDNIISVDDILVKGTFIDDAGIKENNTFAFGLYPNPASDRITLSYILTTASDVNVKIIDNTGRTVKMLNQQNQNGNTSTTVDISELANGIYTVTVETAQGRTSKKFVKG